jgi:hypothetical protein
MRVCCLNITKEDLPSGLCCVYLPHLVILMSLWLDNSNGDSHLKFSYQV